MNEQEKGKEGEELTESARSRSRRLEEVERRRIDGEVPRPCAERTSLWRRCGAPLLELLLRMDEDEACEAPRRIHVAREDR